MSLSGIKPRHFGLRGLRSSIVSASANTLKSRVHSSDKNPFSRAEDTVRTAQAVQELQMENIKAGAKLVTVIVRRELQQSTKPTVQDIFLIWKIKAKFIRGYEQKNGVNLVTLP